MLRSLSTAFILIVMFVWPGSAHSQEHSFTVADSIQMVHFNDPDGRHLPSLWNVSPDGKHVLLVTTKGLVASNEVESTLWLLGIPDAEELLHHSQAQTTSSLTAVLTVRGLLHANQIDSYGSLITKARWSSDSRSIFALVENSNGIRELWKTDSVTKHRQVVSSPGVNVAEYQIEAKGVLYSGFDVAKHSALPYEAGARVVQSVNDTSFFDLLWPAGWFEEKNLYLLDATGVRPLAQMPVSTSDNTFSLSPDGHRVIALVAISRTPANWRNYTTRGQATPVYQLEARIDRHHEILEYDVMDLRTKLRHPLVGSPSGRSGGYLDRPQVVWSQTGSHVLVTNTYLPYEDQNPKEQEKRRRPCAAAYVRIDDGSASCIAWERNDSDADPNSWAVVNLGFGKSEHYVVVDLKWNEHYKTECYSLTGDTWQELPADVCESVSGEHRTRNSTNVLLSLKQSLNEPPRLWAESAATHQRALIWDPNPQIARKQLGEASIYHWQDAEKRDWTGALILPPGYRKGVQYPLVVQTHGFNPDEFLSDGSWTTAMAARPLASAGFIVLQVEDKYDLHYTLEEARLHVQGFEAAIEKLTADGLVDPKRIGIIGFSRTCWYVEEALLETPRRFAAAVVADGVDQSYLQYLMMAPTYTNPETARFYGAKPIGKGLDVWIQSAPGFRLAQLQTPLRLQATSPSSLLMEWEIYSSLKVQNKPVDMVYMPQGQHILQNPSERMASQQGDVDWFRYWLKGEVDQDPAKSAQYERWELLRKQSTY